MQMSGIKDKVTDIWLGAAIFAVMLVFQSFSVLLVERMGRRLMVILSLSGSFISLIIVGIGFYIVGIHSPAITLRPTNFFPSTNQNCLLSSTCDSCIAQPNCGYCFNDISGSFNGSCLPYNPAHPHVSLNGTCSQPLPVSGTQTWATNYCPNPFWWLILFGLILFICFYAPGMGAVPWALNSEIFPSWARSTGNAACVSINWSMSLLTSMTFLSLTKAITRPNTYYLYAALMAIGATFFFFALPETKGRSLEEVGVLFSKPLFSQATLPCKRKKKTKDIEFRDNGKTIVF